MKKKQWEPETIEGWWDSVAECAFAQSKPTPFFGETCEVRIIRKNDYERLLARKTPKRTP